MLNRKKMILIGLLMLTGIGCLYGFFRFVNTGGGADGNLFQNAGFESGPDTKDWAFESWQPVPGGTATGTKFHSGRQSLRLQAATPNDLRFLQKVKVRPDTIYRFSAWVATENVSEGSAGANLSIIDSMLRSQSVTGTRDWQRIEFVFRTYTGQKEVKLALRLGHFGQNASGTAYFDDLQLERVPDSDDVAFQQIARPPDNQPAGAAGPGFIKSYGALGAILLFYLMLLAMIGIRNDAIKQLLPETTDGYCQRNLVRFFVVIAAAALLVRWPFLGEAPFVTDLGNFKAWGMRMLENGPIGFYQSGYYCDYPPFSLYILWLMAGSAKLLGIVNNEALWNACVKIPSFIFDLGTAGLLLLLFRKKNPLFALTLAAIYLFLPAVIYNSAYWGQMDTYYMFFMLLAFYLLLQRKPEWAAVCIAASFLTKAQTIAFIPLYCFYILLHFNWKRWLTSFFAGLAAFILIILPFNIGHSWKWIIELYQSQANLYPYAAMNAGNFIALISGNNVADNIPILFGTINYFAIGITLFTAGIVWSCYYYWRKQTAAGLAVALTISSFVFFMFFPRMHERYLFPTLGFLLLTYGYFKDKRLLFTLLLLSASYLLNMHTVVLKFKNLLDGGSVERSFYILGLLNTVILAWLWLFFQLRFSPNRRSLRQILSEYTTGLRTVLAEKLTLAPFAIIRRDCLMIAVILVCYGLLLFTRLGTTHTPQTGMDFPLGGDGVELTLATPVDVTAIGWYDAEGGGRLRIQGRQNGLWLELGELTCDDYYVMKRLPLASGKLEQIKVSSSGGVGRVNEITLFDSADQVLPIVNVRDLRTGYIETPELHSLTDEAGWMAAKPSSLNSTYFDEIYHGRTAYEFVKKTPVYEVTHPPLGKDILAVGIRLFGMNPFGMRVMHALMGLCLILALFFLGREVLATRFGAYCTMLFGFLDFMPLVQSRYSTVDTTSVLGIALMLIMAFKYLRRQEERPTRGLALGWLAGAIICFALAVSVKWTAAYGFAGVFVCICLAKLRQYLAGRALSLPEEDRLSPGRFLGRNFLPSLGWGLLIAAIAGGIIYYVSYAPFLACRGVPFWSGQGIQEVLRNQVDMFNYHHNLTATHPYSSWWWSWPFDFKPLWLYYNDKNVAPGQWATIVTLGNPAIWWAGSLAFLVLCYQLILWRRFSIIHYLLILMASLYLPWVLVTRITYIYHFYPVLPLFLVLLVFMLEPFWRMKQGRIVVYAFIGGALALLILFFPALTGIPVPKHYIEWLRWFPKDWMF